MEGQTQTTVAPTFDYGTIDLAPVSTNFTAVLAIAVPFALSLLAIRKGISLLMGMIRSA